MDVKIDNILAFRDNRKLYLLLTDLLHRHPHYFRVFDLYACPLSDQLELLALILVKLNMTLLSPYTEIVTSIGAECCKNHSRS